jgi:hypothetical protein
VNRRTCIESAGKGKPYFFTDRQVLKNVSHL